MLRYTRKSVREGPGGEINGSYGVKVSEEQGGFKGRKKALRPDIYNKNYGRGVLREGRKPVCTL